MVATTVSSFSRYGTSQHMLLVTGSLLSTILIQNDDSLYSYCWGQAPYWHNTRATMKGKSAERHDPLLLAALAFIAVLHLPCATSRL